MEIIQLGPWQLSVNDYSLNNPSQRIELEPLLFKLLHYFAKQPRRIITRQELVEAIWQQSYVDDNAINRAISELRKILQHPELPVSPIKTHHRKGYSLQLDPKYTNQLQQPAAAIALEPHHSSDASRTTAPTQSKANRKRFALYLSAGLLFMLLVSYFLITDNTATSSNIADKAIAADTPALQTRQQLEILTRQKVTWFKGIESRPLLSPDKAYLAYSHTLPNNHVRTIVRKQSSAVGSAPQEMIIEDAENLIFAHTWQPQSQTLLVQKFSKEGSSCSFIRYNFATFPAGPGEHVSQCQHLNISPAQLSKDGETLFRSQSNNGMLTPSALVAENLQTGHIRVLADAPTSGFGVAMLALSPDGEQLAYIFMPESNQPEIYLYSLKRREKQRLAALPIPLMLMGLDWTADGNYLLMPANNALLKLDINSKTLTTQLLPADLPVGEITLLSEHQAYISPLSFGSAVQGGFQILRVSHPFNPEKTQITPFSEAAGSTHELIFNPQDQKLQAFTANWNGNWQLWLSDGTQYYAVTEFTESDVMIGSLSWSENGRYIALTRKGNLFLYDIQRKQLLQKTQSNDIAQTLWLPDNSGLIVTRIQQSDQNLWQLDLLSGELQQLTFIAAAQPQFDASGQLHYVRDGQLYRYVDGRRADLALSELNPGSLYHGNQFWGEQLLSFSLMGHLRLQAVTTAVNSPIIEAQLPYQIMSVYPNPHNPTELFVSIFQPPEMALEYIEWRETHLTTAEPAKP